MTIRDDAYNWAADYIDAQEEIAPTFVWDGMSDKEWSAHLDFITECFEKGVKPIRFVELLIHFQRSVNLIFAHFTDELEDREESCE